MADGGGFRWAEIDARALLDGIVFSFQLDDTVTFYHVDELMCIGQ